MSFRGLIKRWMRGLTVSKTALGVASGALLVLSFPAVSAADPAGKPIGVVELFTSQGCNSCPPADTAFSELAAKGDVVALSYHVDYWDYLGWRDTFGQPENTDRQYQYMKAFGGQSVYTPQAVINGRKHVNGSSREDISRSLRELEGQGGGLSVAIKATHQGNTLKIEADAASGGPSEAEVVLVYFDPPTPVEIERGENNGRTITYWNAVTDVQVAGMWHGKSTSFDLPMREVAKNGNGGCAVLLQAVNSDGSPGPILGATVVRAPQS